MDCRTIFLLLVLLPSTLSGCFGEEEKPASEDETQSWPHPWERAGINYTVSAEFSRVTTNGTFGIDNVRSIYVPVDTITVADGGAGLTGDAEVHLGLWLPVIEGCDWEGANLLKNAKSRLLPKSDRIIVMET